MRTSKVCSTLDDIPYRKHWVILKQSSVYVPGDERSRTNPGHGYPASTTHYMEYLSFSTREDWVAEIESLEKYKQHFRAMVVEPAIVTTDVKVAITG